MRPENEDLAKLFQKDRFQQIGATRLFRDSGWFLERLNEGLDSRGWLDVGEFEAVGEDLIHRLKYSIS